MMRERGSVRSRVTRVSVAMSCTLRGRERHGERKREDASISPSKIRVTRVRVGFVL